MQIVIIDDDPLVTASLQTILEADDQIRVVVVGNSGEEAVRLYGQYQPDILLMDIRMEKMNGIEAAKQILIGHPTAKILFLTTFSDNDYIIQALHIGARGYILKQDYEKIVPALKAVYSGQSVFGGEIVSKIPKLIKDSVPFDYRAYDISEKEEDIIILVAAGLSNKEIAEKLFLSEGTVRNYLSIVLEKLGLRDRTQLAIFYYRHT